MNCRIVAAAAIACCLVWSACGGHKAAAVAIVEKDGMVAVMGEVEWVNEGGAFRPNIWKAGNIVIFRVDGTFGSETGKLGKAYRINQANKFEELGAVDLTKSNKELAGQYGVKAK